MVKPTDRPFAERTIGLHRRLEPRFELDVPIYTPEEFERFCRKRSFFRNESRQKEERCVKKGADDWWSFADGDFNAARVMYSDGSYPQMCFHAQQAAGRAHKTMVVAEGRTPEKTHAISPVLEEVPDL